MTTIKVAGKFPQLLLVLGLVSVQTAWAQDVARVLWSDGAENFTTIQAAFDEAESRGGQIEVRMRGGNHVDVFTLEVNDGDGFLISGRWNEAFNEQNDIRTSLSSAWADTVIRVVATGGELQLLNFSIREGDGFDAGGMLLTTSGDSVVFMSELSIDQNIVRSAGLARARGAGLRIVSSDTSVVEMEESKMVGNSAETEGGDDVNIVEGAGLHATALENATIYIDSSEFINNRCRGGFFDEPGLGAGCNVYISALANSNVTFVGNYMTDASSLRLEGGIDDSLNGHLSCSDNATLLEGTNQWLNGDPTGGDRSLFLQARHACSLVAQSSLVANSPVNGVHAVLLTEGAQAGLSLHMSNYTVAGNEDQGLFLNNQTPLGIASASNTLAYDNGLNTTGDNASFTGMVTTSANLIAVDPLFRKQNADDYSVLEGSPAIDMGDTSPPGGLSARDIEGNMRQNGIVDIGAWEFQPSLVPVDGRCGGSDGKVLDMDEEPTSLCFEGLPTPVSGQGPWTWSCLGENGGSDASCSASVSSYQISVTIQPVGAGSVSCTPNPVNGGGDSLCTTTANPGFVFEKWTGDSDCSTHVFCELKTIRNDVDLVAIFSGMATDEIFSDGFE